MGAVPVQRLRAAVQDGEGRIDREPSALCKLRLLFAGRFEVSEDTYLL